MAGGSRDRGPLHPIQPVVGDDHGVLRFKRNHIVCDLLATASGDVPNPGLDLNEIALRVVNGQYSKDDHDQLRQLIGYSVSGFPGSEDIKEAAMEMFESVGKLDPWCERWRSLKLRIERAKEAWSEARDLVESELGE